MAALNEAEHDKTLLFGHNPPWWKNRCTLWYGLLASGILTFLFYTIFDIVTIKTPPRSGNVATHMEIIIVHKRIKSVEILSMNVSNLKKKKIGGDTCFVPDCIYAASSILKKMDLGVNPCDNFYKFVCGKYLNSTVVPDDKSSVNSFTAISDKVDEQLKTTMEEKSGTREHKHVRLIKSLYKSCMNKEVIEARGLEPLRIFLRKFGGWPVKDGNGWHGNLDWIAISKRFRQIGYPTNFLINFKVVIDPKNASRHIIALDQPRLGVPRGYLLKGFQDEIVQEYFKYMVDIAMILGAPKHRAIIELRESLQFEIQLANITVPAEHRRNPGSLYNPMTMTELAQSYTNVPWREYFDSLLPSGTNVGINEVVIIAVPRYIANFAKLMVVTTKRTHANYLIWRAIDTSIGYTDNRLRRRQLDFSKVFTGRSKLMPRWRECVKVVSHSLPTSVGAVYVSKFFNEDAKRNAIEIVTNIRRQFDLMLQQARWLDEKTRRSAREKLVAMVNHIGYPTELLDSRKLEKHLKNLELSDYRYYENILSIRRFFTEYGYGKLRKSVDKHDWIRHGNAAVANAFYSPDKNSIQLPAAILQGDFFSTRRPKYMNYGGIGFVIGHEITHGFDDRGRQFDKNGNLMDWWQPATKEQYLKRANCLVDQYEHYIANDIGLNVNGLITEGENIADNGGLKGSYHAYNNWAAVNEPEKKLPGLPYEPRQMFWISVANAWCSKYSPEQLKLRMTQDCHSPAEFRILGSLSNAPEFSKDFNCPVGSKMNPMKKCLIW